MKWRANPAAPVDSRLRLLFTNEYRGRAPLSSDVSPRSYENESSILLVVVIGLALLILGYVGVLAFMPDKTAGGAQITSFLLSVLMLLAGAAGMTCTLVYALAKGTIERKRRRTAGALKN